MCLLVYSCFSVILKTATPNPTLKIMANIVARCHKLVEAEILRRSSQVVSVVGDKVYIFGGELRPREPRDNDVHVVSLDSSKLLESILKGDETDPCPI